jgi:hypothetical protein
MGKVYQFPTNRKKKATSTGMNHSPENESLRKAIAVLVQSYTSRVAQLEGYIEEIKQIDGVQIKGPKAVMAQVKDLNKMFYKYGISVNFYKFITTANKVLLYFNDREVVYTHEINSKHKMQSFTKGEFITEFASQRFTLTLDESIYEAISKRIEELRITIGTLEHTKI